MKIYTQEVSFNFDYFGQTPPDTIVQEFVIPHKISNNYNFINSIAFSPSGNAIACGLTDSIWSSSTILYSYKTQGGWTQFDTIPFCVQGINTNPTFLNDSVLYFSSRGNIQIERTVDFDIFRVVKVNNNWQIPEKVKELSLDTCREFMGTFSKNGEVYFTRLEQLKQPDRNNPVNNEIYRGKLINGSFCNIENIGKPINTNHGEAAPFIDPLGKYLLFCSSRNNGFGLADTYISFKLKDGVWSEPQNMGNVINSNEIDADAIVTPDGKYLFFIRRQDWKCEIPNRIYWVSTKILDKYKFE